MALGARNFCILHVREMLSSVKYYVFEWWEMNEFRMLTQYFPDTLLATRAILASHVGRHERERGILRTCSVCCLWWRYGEMRQNWAYFIPRTYEEIYLCNTTIPTGRTAYLTICFAFHETGRACLYALGFILQ